MQCTFEGNAAVIFRAQANDLNVLLLSTRNDKLPLRNDRTKSHKKSTINIWLYATSTGKHLQIFLGVFNPMRNKFRAVHKATAICENKQIYFYTRAQLNYKHSS